MNINYFEAYLKYINICAACGQDCCCIYYYSYYYLFIWKQTQGYEDGTMDDKLIYPLPSLSILIKKIIPYADYHYCSKLLGTVALYNAHFN